MIRKSTNRCWPAANRSKRAWRVAARGGAGHASATWRQWMEPVRPDPRGVMAPTDEWGDAARMARREEDEN